MELQCTTCHDAHDNSRGKFLVMDNSASQLCNACHTPGVTTIIAHQQCASCHQPHTAPSGPWLLKGPKVASTCTGCHSGQVGPNYGVDVASDLRKLSIHETEPVVNQLTHAPDAATCTDCHGPHTMTSGAAVAPNIPSSFGKVKGINIAGAEVDPARYEYEVCFRCHGDNSTRQPYVPRQITQNNTRLEFAPTAISFHPVAAPGKNSEVPSLRVGLATTSQIYCSDCHTSDTGQKAGGVGADGTHGSNVKPLLIARYDTRDGTAESAATYALCYRCHDRASILNDESFPLHRKHIVDTRTPCSVCHDGHGISSTQGNSTSNSHLINFDTTVVTPFNGIMRFRDTGVRSGTCTLSCHDRPHNELGY
jgi:predicted CXXCH cytochrome family protein